MSCRKLVVWLMRHTTPLNGSHCPQTFSGSGDFIQVAKGVKWPLLLDDVRSLAGVRVFSSACLFGLTVFRS